MPARARKAAPPKTAVPLDHPEPPADSIFLSQNSQFSAYLLAANILNYRGCELTGTGWDVVFAFDDPNCIGEDLLRRFNAGISELVNARALFEARSFLLGEIKRKQSAVGVDSGKAL